MNKKCNEVKMTKTGQSLFRVLKSHDPGKHEKVPKMSQTSFLVKTFPQYSAFK